ncbi:hypothetical protein [Streptomyces zhihengii]
MTTQPHTTPGTNTSTVDGALTERCQNHGDYIAGLIAAGHLDTLGRPDKLPGDLFPDIEPWIVDAIWQRALTVGVWVGKALARPQWTPEALDRLRTALHEAGYQGMAAKTARTAAVHPARRPMPFDQPATATHPADADTARTGGHP